MKNQFLKITKFFNETIWEVKDESLSPFQQKLYKQLRIIIIAINRYLKNEGNLNASALTFFTLLSIVPILAMAFGIAKGFGLERVLETQIREKLYGQDEIIEKLMVFSKSMLANTKGSIIAGIGFILVFYSVLKMINSIESAFNKAWGIEKERTFYRKFTDYTSFVVIAPILFVAASSISVFVTSELENVVRQLNLIGVLEFLIAFALELLSFTLIWLLMMMLYILMPNTKVSWKAGVQSGIVIGTLFSLTQWMYVNFQFGVARANAVYGSFAALPLFLAWLQVSWFIVVFGAGYTYSIQNEDLQRHKLSAKKLSIYNLKKIALLITHLVIQDFAKANSPTKAEVILEKLKMPKNTVYEILDWLVKSKVISEVVNEKEKSFQPASDIHRLTIGKVLHMLEDTQDKAYEINHLEISQRFDEIFGEFRQLTSESKHNQLLLHL